MKHSILILVCLAAPVAAQESPSDFFDLRMTECTATLGYIGPSDETLKTVEGKKPEIVCLREGERILCNLTMEGDASTKGSKVEYRVDLEGPTFLYFGSPNGADFYALDFANRRVVLISRYMSSDGNIVGAKVCRGTYSAR